MERHIEAMAMLNIVLNEIETIADRLRDLHEARQALERVVHDAGQAAGMEAHINTDGQWAWDEDGWK